MTTTISAPATVEEIVLPPVTSLPKRIFKHPRLMHHNRLAALVLAANVPLLVRALTEGLGLAAMSGVVLANFALAILIRQQYVINVLFWLATRAPVHWPLRIRWTLAKVYHFGGLHVGGALAGTLWFLILTVSLTLAAIRRDPAISANQIVISCALLIVLLTMVVMARPGYRAKRHNRFELMHRFGGWTALFLFWAQTVLLVRSGPGVSLLSAPQIWVLALLTFSIALPWLRLRKVPVRVTRPSSHVALAHFTYGVTPFAGSSTAVSRRPLLEWHSFANVPSPGEPGFRLTISRAGDWTGSFIDEMPSHVWVKGITTAGVANIETLFSKVVYVATGSGIGPVLPHLLARKVPSRLVWATRSPRITYGDALVDEILSCQQDATVWDTAEHGKPDMVRLAYEAYVAFGAEAVICISNKKLTWEVVHGLERRGIPAYGAIWDS
ncbi:ferredoxin reductase domain-containing protein [Catelliglobosispora koreensis]|uniref:hypothetical protein n=1 Tax=Catelliglobosispora koreensis TaxID=129052 RepID=UPI0003604E1A|nr:hypothetical protein [Catelliglobosispora koreensis]